MRWVVNAKPRPFLPQERPDTQCIGNCVVPMTGLGGYGKSRQPPKTGIQSPHRPARSESLCRLSNLGYH